MQAKARRREVIERPIGVGCGGLSILEKIRHMRRGILFVELERLLLRGWSGCLIGGGRLSWRVGGVDAGQTSEKEYGKI